MTGAKKGPQEHPLVTPIKVRVENCLLYHQVGLGMVGGVVFPCHLPDPYTPHSETVTN